MNMKVGLFDSYSSADRAVQALENYGVESSRISVVTRDNDTIRGGNNATEAGATTGAAAGGLIGLLTGLSALVIPGIGPVIATGMLANALATTLGMTAVGAGLGAIAGVLLGALIDLGFSREQAEFYAEGVKRGGVLVSVETDEEEEEQVSEILHSAGAVDMDDRVKTWKGEGWTTFEETEEPEENYRR